MSSKVMKKIIFDVRPGERLKEYGIKGLSKILSNLKSPGGVCFQTMQDDILSGGDICKLPHDKITHVIDFIIEKEDHLEVHISLWKDFDDDTITKFQLYLNGLVNIYHVYNPDNWIFARLSLGDAVKVNPFIISKIKEIVHPQLTSSNPLTIHPNKATSYTLTVNDQSGKKEVFSLNVEKDTEIIVDDEDRTIFFNVMFKEG